MPFLEGLGYGLATVLLIGPVFFTLLKAALDHGAKGGIAVAAGIIVSDIAIVVICLSGLATALEEWITGPWMAVAAGLILLGLGVRYIVRPMVRMERPVRAFGRSAAGSFTAGFLVNFVNPFVFAIWIAAVLHATHVHGTGSGAHAFLIGMLTGILLTDLIKALLAPQLRPFLTPRALKRTFLGIGIAMLLFSFRVFVHAAHGWN